MLSEKSISFTLIKKLATYTHKTDFTCRRINETYTLPCKAISNVVKWSRARKESTIAEMTV